MNNLEFYKFTNRLVEEEEERLMWFYSSLDWCKETIENKSTQRSADSPATYYSDKLFESKMNKAIVETDKYYSNMMYKEA